MHSLTLVQVSDNKNNNLSLIRNGSQITSVSLNSGTQGDIQACRLATAPHCAAG